MRAASGMIAVSVGWGIGLALAPVALAQSGAPSQSEITNALRPVPPAMQKGEQGLPTPGTAPLATPSRPTTKTSLTGGGPATASQGAMYPTLPGCTASNAAPRAAVTLPTITFKFGSAQLKHEAVATLQNLAKSLKQDFPATNSFVIEGHTDATGSFAYNQELSRERAEAVRDYLTQQMGVDPNQLTVSGMGYCDLANPADPRGAENRRVVVVNKAS